jgi:hypothetical protein
MLILQICFGILLANFILFLLSIEKLNMFILASLYIFISIGLLTIYKPESINSSAVVIFFTNFFGR